MSKGIYKFNWDCGRMGDIDGVFVAEKAEIESLIGKHIDFGESLGKHSQIDGTLHAEHIKLVTENEEFIALFEQYQLSNGHNPLCYPYRALDEQEWHDPIR